MMASPAPVPDARRPADWRVACFVLASVLVLGVVLVRSYRPLGTIGGFISPHYGMGLHYAAEGTIGEEGRPTVFKPPGYPAFLGTLLRAVLGPPPVEPERSPRGVRADWRWASPAQP